MCPTLLFMIYLIGLVNVKKLFYIMESILFLVNNNVCMKNIDFSYNLKYTGTHPVYLKSFKI